MTPPPRDARSFDTAARGEALERWGLLLGLTAALAAGVFLRGGVDPAQWVWINALLLLLGLAARVNRGARDRALETLCWALCLWVGFALLPLPQALVHFLSPRAAEIWLAAGRTGWIPLSIAPAATTSEVLRLVATLSALLAAARLAWLWRARPWVAAAPVVFIAFLQSLLGLLQSAAGVHGPVSGSYVNRNHFAGLLEMALPLAVAIGVAFYFSGATRYSASARAATLAGLWLAIALSLLAAILFSLSRTGFLAALGGLAATALAAAVPARRRLWRYAAAAAVLLVLVFIYLPPDLLLARFATLSHADDLASDTRPFVWRQTLRLIQDYPVTGAGLGSYEWAFLPFQTAAPDRTVDFAHNDYLQVAAELGLPGLALSLALVSLLFARLVRALAAARRKPDWLAAGLLGALTALLLHSITDFNLYIPANALAAAWLAGLAATPGLQRAPRV